MNNKQIGIAVEQDVMSTHRDVGDDDDNDEDPGEQEEQQDDSEEDEDDDSDDDDDDDEEDNEDDDEDEDKAKKVKKGGQKKKKRKDETPSVEELEDVPYRKDYPDRDEGYIMIDSVYDLDKAEQPVIIKNHL
jgi:hypothetical protein